MPNKLFHHVMFNLLASGRGGQGIRRDGVISVCVPLEVHFDQADFLSIFVSPQQCGCEYDDLRMMQ